MSAHRRSRHFCSLILFAGILTVPVVPAFAQTLAFNDQPGYPQYAGQMLAFGPMQNYQPGFQQYAPQTAPQTQEPSDSAASDQLPPQLRHQVVAYSSTEPAGTIIIDTAHKFLYLTMGGGRAMRYGIGVGRQGFTWSGVQTISRKSEWPDWIPPVEMVARQPYLPRWVGGGPGNPLGARAMYLGNTEYRIHGTNDPTTIGKNVSSGCIRLENSEVDGSLPARRYRHQSHRSSQRPARLRRTRVGERRRQRRDRSRSRRPHDGADNGCAARRRAAGADRRAVTSPLSLPEARPRDAPLRVVPSRPRRGTNSRPDILS